MTTENWGDDVRRAPDLQEGDVIIFSECGRVLFNTCYRSFYHRLVKRDGATVLLTKHGAGQEEYASYLLDRIIPALSALNSDQRYLVLHQMFRANKDGKLEGRDKTAATYRNAFVEGRLKKRKMPRSPEVKVWIESKPLKIESGVLS